MKKCLLLLAFIVVASPSGYTQPVPADKNTPPAVTPFASSEAIPPVSPEDKNLREVMLEKLIQAGILMLEGGAYRQFIQTFVTDEDRRRFEKAYAKNGPVDYARWGVEKGQPMLAILRQLAVSEPQWLGQRACYAAEGLPQQRFSFLFNGDGWFIENRSACP
jgi:hypothetical protein